MHLDPFIPLFVYIVLALSVMSILAHLVKQPPIIAYILTGILLGPFGLKIIDNSDELHRLGAIGVIFLLFFIGMEISPEKLIKNWKISVFGTALQIFISVGAVAVLGFVLEWSLNRCLLIGFVISLSSTAVVLKLLEEKKELQTLEGQDVLGVLLVQDLAIIPMLIIISYLGPNSSHLYQVGLQLVGALFLGGIVVWVTIKKNFSMPFSHLIREDKELQVLVSLVVCFGLALISGLLELSSALGAFVAGIIIGSSEDTHWVHESLHGFRVVFMALFFVSIGILVDFSFISEHWVKIFILVFAVILINTFINSLTIKLLGRTWKSSIYSGALLSQVGEFSFMLATVGLQAAIINDFSYQFTISIIALSLIVSPFWIVFISSFFKNK